MQWMITDLKGAAGVPRGLQLFVCIRRHRPECNDAEEASGQSCCRYWQDKLWLLPLMLLSPARHLFTTRAVRSCSLGAPVG